MRGKEICVPQEFLPKAGIIRRESTSEHRIYITLGYPGGVRDGSRGVYGFERVTITKYEKGTVVKNEKVRVGFYGPGRACEGNDRVVILEDGRIVDAKGFANDLSQEGLFQEARRLRDEFLDCPIKWAVEPANGVSYTNGKSSNLRNYGSFAEAQIQ